MRRTGPLLFAFGGVIAAAGACANPAPPPATAATPRPPEPALVSHAASRVDPVVDADAGAVAPAEPKPSEDTAQAMPPATAEAEGASACNEQPPQEFLIRKNFLPRGSPEEIKRRQALHQETIRYRTENYGYFEGFGKREWNPHEPNYYAVNTTFMGLPIRMHKRVVPALKCVEEEIKRVCADHPYQPRALAGIRFRNTYRGGEVTNHAYGIAIDIDPHLNTCCGCVKPWSSNPLCTKPVKSEYERMVMPECWVHVFERFGFYWLGHDVLQDTMHFEFLGDPDKILKRAPQAAAN